MAAAARSGVAPWLLCARGTWRRSMTRWQEPQADARRQQLAALSGHPTVAVPAAAEPAARQRGNRRSSRGSAGIDLPEMPLWSPRAAAIRRVAATDGLGSGGSGPRETHASPPAAPMLWALFTRGAPPSSDACGGAGATPGVAPAAASSATPPREQQSSGPVQDTASVRAVDVSQRAATLRVELQPVEFVFRPEALWRAQLLFVRAMSARTALFPPLAPLFAGTVVGDGGGAARPSAAAAAGAAAPTPRVWSPDGGLAATVALAVRLRAVSVIVPREREGDHDGAAERHGACVVIDLGGASLESVADACSAGSSSAAERGAASVDNAAAADAEELPEDLRQHDALFARLRLRMDGLRALVLPSCALVATGPSREGGADEAGDAWDVVLARFGGALQSGADSSPRAPSAAVAAMASSRFALLQPCSARMTVFTLAAKRSTGIAASPRLPTRVVCGSVSGVHVQACGHAFVCATSLLGVAWTAWRNNASARPVETATVGSWRVRLSAPVVLATLGVEAAELREHLEVSVAAALHANASLLQPAAVASLAGVRLA